MTMTMLLTTPIRLVPLALIVILGTGCGDDSPTAPSVVEVSSIWTGTVTQTRAIGVTPDGDALECLGLFLDGFSDRYTMSTTQAGSSLTATASSQTGGQTCNYSGGAGSSSVVLAAIIPSCNPAGYQATCNGQPRDVVLATRSVAGDVSGNTMSGTISDRWTIFAADHGPALGAFVVTNSFSFQR
jgi:hypothetical protein